MTPLTRHSAEEPRKTLMERLEDAMLPLINLVFLLLMFFIVAGQLTEEPLPELPKSQDKPADQRPVADIVVTRGGEWRVNGKIVTEQTLGASIRSFDNADSSEPLRIGANRNLRMKELAPLLKALESAGFETVTILTEPNQ